MPMVSVVLPTYNGAKYIRESIDSICRQIYTDWELIIVDDCSYDNTLEIAHEYATRDNRIRVIHNKVNQKLPEALNIGFRYAEGKYLTWTSDDNMYHEKALASMSHVLEQNENIYMVCSQMMNIDGQGRKLGLSGIWQDAELFYTNNVGACFMYRKCVLQDVGEYDKELFLAEDYDYWVRVLERYGEIYRLEEPLYYYRRHSCTLTQTKKEMIAGQVLKVKDKHIMFWLETYKNKPQMACRLYFDYMERGGDVEKIEQYTLEIVPQLVNVQEDLGDKRIVVLGAGRVGKQAAALFGSKVEAFADNDIKKVGLYLDGFPIISFTEMIEVKENIDIMLAVPGQYIYELLLQLASQGVEKYMIFQKLLYKQRQEKGKGESL